MSDTKSIRETAEEIADGWTHEEYHGVKLANAIEQALRNERERCARVIGPLMENHKHHCTNNANAGMLWVEVDAAIRKDD